MKVYNKLIRDKIPEIMEKSNKIFEIRTMNNSEYAKMLIVKLHEELKEFDEAIENEQIAELADIVEVIYSILESKGIGVDEFEQVRLRTKEERGGFTKKLLLISAD